MRVQYGDNFGVLGTRERDVIIDIAFRIHNHSVRAIYNKVRGVSQTFDEVTFYM
jgi:hypothetical protein